MRGSLLVCAIFVICAIWVAACASGKGGSKDIDAGTSSTYEDAGVDAPAKHGFGEPCTDNKQCESGLCILIGTSGQCTETCGDCPSGYGCVGVTGIQIEGQVTFVCVPTSNQLCTTCSMDSECTLIGMDKCVQYPDGDRACARDCTAVGCPTGYECETVNISGTNYKQCMAASGACDCSEANPGAMQPCNIMTPWNVCIGAQTCGGASGWGTCQPPSMNDDPDPSFVDSNCDGIDGDRARAIFVSPAGVNSTTCGLVYTDPCQTIGFGIARAQAANRPHVYLQSGTYTASVTMANGISVYGGYNFNWQRKAYSESGHTVTIVGGTTAVRFTNITMPTWLDNVVVRSANATTTGGSSFGVVITGSMNVELRAVLVEPGAGAAGTSGTNGTAGVAGGPGGNGNPGVERSSGFCDNRPLPSGGAGGDSQCGRFGGAGGVPGVGDGTGQIGFDGIINPQSGGFGGVSRANGQPGAPGLSGGPGGNGAPGANIGSFASTTYAPANGGDGGDGDHGNGGGGGGGGGGGTTDCDSTGSSGGGGGGGGCGGTRGFGGTGGGGSFGVLALDSDVVLNGCSIKGGSGGAGGAGGIGGDGGGGGTAGGGGPYGGGSEQDDGGMGAGGGGGGSGGRAGDGGGGGGGPSVAIVCLGSSASAVAFASSILTPGTGGAGGASNSPGSTGLSATTYGCN